MHLTCRDLEHGLARTFKFDHQVNYYHVRFSNGDLPRDGVTRINIALTWAVRCIDRSLEQMSFDIHLIRS